MPHDFCSAGRKANKNKRLTLENCLSICLSITLFCQKKKKKKKSHVWRQVQHHPALLCLLFYMTLFITVKCCFFSTLFILCFDYALSHEGFVSLEYTNFWMMLLLGFVISVLITVRFTAVVLTVYVWFQSSVRAHFYFINTTGSRFDPSTERQQQTNKQQWHQEP